MFISVSPGVTFLDVFVDYNSNMLYKQLQAGRINSVNIINFNYQLFVVTYY